MAVLSSQTIHTCFAVAFRTQAFSRFVTGELKLNSFVFLCFSLSALFLVDAVNEMYLWHGWWPQSDEDSDSRASTTGSAETRWSNDRRLAMETTKSYAEGSYSHLCVRNHVQVDLMGKQFPFLKISL